MKKLIQLFLLPLCLLAFTASLTYSQSLNITAGTIKDHSDDDRYQVNVSYPVFDFGPEALMGMRGVAGDMNKQITDMITPKVDSFKYYAKENLKALKEMGSALLNEKVNSYLSITYKVNCKGDGFVSIMFTQEEYDLGAAHPNHYSFVYNSIADGGDLKLSDLFKAKSGYLKFLSQYTRSDLKKQFKANNIDVDNSMLNAGTKADANSFSNWGIDGENLIIHFDPYAVGPYVIGDQEVKISKAKLSKYLNNKVDVWSKCK